MKTVFVRFCRTYDVELVMNDSEKLTEEELRDRATALVLAEPDQYSGPLEFDGVEDGAEE